MREQSPFFKKKIGLRRKKKVKVFTRLAEAIKKAKENKKRERKRRVIYAH